MYSEEMYNEVKDGCSSIVVLTSECVDGSDMWFFTGAIRRKEWGVSMGEWKSVLKGVVAADINALIASDVFRKKCHLD